MKPLTRLELEQQTLLTSKAARNFNAVAEKIDELVDALNEMREKIRKLEVSLDFKADAMPTDGFFENLNEKTGSSSEVEPAEPESCVEYSKKTLLTCNQSADIEDCPKHSPKEPIGTHEDTYGETKEAIGGSEEPTTGEDLESRFDERFAPFGKNSNGFKLEYHENRGGDRWNVYEASDQLKAFIREEKAASYKEGFSDAY